jgi:hypothetical protein
MVQILRSVGRQSNEREIRSHAVKVLCAWCVRDGKPAFMREKLPLNDPSETHGLCGDHFTSLSASVGKVVDSRAWLLSRMNRLCWGLIRWRQRLMGRWFPVY